MGHAKKNKNNKHVFFKKNDMVHLTVYASVWVSTCVSARVCVGVCFRVSAWRVGAWVYGCMRVWVSESSVLS